MWSPLNRVNFQRHWSLEVNSCLQWPPEALSVKRSTHGTNWLIFQLRSTTAYGKLCRKEGNVLFNDALNTFYLRLYGVRHMVKDHSDSERGNPLPPHGLLFSINSKGSFICTIPQTG